VKGRIESKPTNRSSAFGGGATAPRRACAVNRESGTEAANRLQGGVEPFTPALRSTYDRRSHIEIKLLQLTSQLAQFGVAVRFGF